MNKKMPIIAICYDFDKTLTPDDMQAQGFIQSVENDVEEFWKKSNSLAKELLKVTYSLGRHDYQSS